MNETKDKALAALEKAQIEAVVTFDQCVVVMALLEDGEIMVESYVAGSEGLDPEAAAEACLAKMMIRLKERENTMGLTEHQADIIITLAESKMNLTEVGRKLTYHRNSLSRHIKKIHEQTGKDPMDFYDMCDLLIAARNVKGQA